MTIDQAMILAAGFGTRLRPFTDNLPKPLLEINGKTLIARHLDKLAAIGVTRVLINVAYLGDKIKASIGNGERWGIAITYSTEPETEPLDTGGAVGKVLKWFDNKPFIIVAADIWTEYDFAQLKSLDAEEMGHLLLAKKPHWASKSDFTLDDDNILSSDDQGDYTFAGIGIMHPQLWQNQYEQRYPITKVLAGPLANRAISGSLCGQSWFNIGCINRLRELCEHLDITTADTNYHQVCDNKP